MSLLGKSGSYFLYNFRTFWKTLEKQFVSSSFLLIKNFFEIDYCQEQTFSQAGKKKWNSLIQSIDSNFLCWQKLRINVTNVTMMLIQQIEIAFSTFYGKKVD